MESMDNHRPEALLDLYLSGAASAAETAALAAQLQASPPFRRQFADRMLLEIHLHKAFAGMAPAVLPTARRSNKTLLRWLVAAVLLLAVGITAVAWWTRGPAPTPAPIAALELVAGEVRVDGVAVKQVPEDRWFEVAPDGPAVIRLADGSEAELLPASKALIRARGTGVRQSFDVERGGGKFKITPAAAQFRVSTAVANVTVLGTEFSVKLDVRGKSEGKRGKVKPILTVAVTAGSVRVDAGAKSTVLAAGERKTFELKKDDDDD